MPLADNGEVVLNTLVVDVLVLLHVGHLDLLGSRGSGRLGKGAKGSLDGSSLCVCYRKDIIENAYTLGAHSTSDQDEGKQAAK